MGQLFQGADCERLLGGRLTLGRRLNSLAWGLTKPSAGSRNQLQALPFTLSVSASKLACRLAHAPAATQWHPLSSTAGVFSPPSGRLGAACGKLDCRARIKLLSGFRFRFHFRRSPFGWSVCRPPPSDQWQSPGRMDHVRAPERRNINPTEARGRLEAGQREYKSKRTFPG